MTSNGDGVMLMTVTTSRRSQPRATSAPDQQAQNIFDHYNRYTTGVGDTPTAVYISVGLVLYR